MNRNRKRWPRGTWMELANREGLVDAMERRGFSLDRLARYAGCSKGMVSHLTSGRRKTCSPQLAQNIAEALDMPLSLLFVPKVSTQQGRIANRTKTGALVA